MSTFDDSSFEMHDDSLTPEAAERLLDGETLSPEFTDLTAMVNDVRTMTSATPTPAVRGALAEYVGVGLTAAESAEPPAPAAVSADLDLTTADQPRRRTVFAEVLTFAGTVSGKLLLGGAVAVASVSGAQATGIVDLPGLPDKETTVVVADTPVDEAPAELPLEDKVEESEPDVVETDKIPATDFAAEFEEAKDKAEEAAEKAAEELAAAEKEAAEKEAAEKEAAEKAAAEKAAAEKAAAEKEAAEKAEAEKDKPKEEEPSEEAEALLAQLLEDKEAVYAAATALIKPLEAEKKPLVEALEATLGTLEQARNDAKAPLYAELETTEDAERRAEIEAELSAIFEQWELDRDAAKAAANPAINAINVQLENIEIERDAEITRLKEQYRADLEALQK
jgi:chemotaxis protein histidine kinase CheA